MVVIIAMSLTQLIAAGIYALVQVSRDAPVSLAVYSQHHQPSALEIHKGARLQQERAIAGCRGLRTRAGAVSLSIGREKVLLSEVAASLSLRLASPLGCVHFHLDSHCPVQSSGPCDPCFLLTQPWMSFLVLSQENTAVMFSKGNFLK